MARLVGAGKREQLVDLFQDLFGLTFHRCGYVVGREAREIGDTVVRDGA
jgi:hypothetical protein